ncbi:D-sedoheptulose 7-phosphate isomerase [Candidatus Sulfidibacterium hydrothermale]|uniref:D-sedoheptulose-7-phosphate isomerase n=1 Tax=Candidatus Sulfidibacterium hydrothermale TaxID=2875962 RepID=UPI001F0A1E5D|nr:D-sedoheptulose 7-phosphate isomerase [Candidatus Sulfidibacterium hydrothermale]UBM61932.1 D-sedoheptulose 7-phosphate isomerase [Candidatus Sulfidibacterium hydrothermale]
MDFIIKAFQESIRVKKAFFDDPERMELIKTAAEYCIESLEQGGKILFCGNGGSASDAQHLAAELSGRFQYDRKPLYAEALHVNTSFLTAVANDYGYEEVYRRMVEAAGRRIDVLIALSTSGNSPNVVNAVRQAKEQHMITIGFTGENGGKLAELCELCIRVPSENTARIQEMHILIGHAICEKIERTLFPQ